MDSDWKSGDADFWKDDEWKARDSVAVMRQYVGEALRIVRRAELVKLRSSVLVILPQPGDIVEMIDRALARLDSEPPESLLPEDLQ